MGASIPIRFQWDGEAMVPDGQHWARRADEQYVVGEYYRLEIREERSHTSHAHYFAAVHDAWGNLPEHLAAEYPTDEKLRKHALIKAGYFDQKDVVFETPDDAQKAAAFARSIDEYAVVTVKGCVVRMYTAKSQDYRSMDKATFQKSKDDVLDVLARLIEVEPRDLEREAGRAA